MQKSGGKIKVLFLGKLHFMSDHSTVSNSNWKVPNHF